MKQKEKKEIAERAYQLQNVVENGMIHLYRTNTGEITYTLNDSENRELTHLFSFNILNENKPYSRKDFIDIIDYEDMVLT